MITLERKLKTCYERGAIYVRGYNLGSFIENANGVAYQIDETHDKDMVPWDLNGYVAGSIWIQTDGGEGCQIEMKESGVYRGKVQMKLGAASRYLVEDQGLLLRRLRRVSAV